MDTELADPQTTLPNSRRAAGDGMSERARQAVENYAGFFDVLARWTSPDLPAPLVPPDPEVAG
jgi:hypothetical protein